MLSLRKERQRNLAAWFDPVKQGAALRRVEEEVCGLIPQPIYLLHINLYMIHEMLSTFFV